MFIKATSLYMSYFSRSSFRFWINLSAKTLLSDLRRTLKTFAKPPDPNLYLLVMS